MVRRVLRARSATRPRVELSLHATDDLTPEEIATNELERHDCHVPRHDSRGVRRSRAAPALRWLVAWLVARDACGQCPAHARPGVAEGSPRRSLGFRLVRL